MCLLLYAQNTVPGYRVVLAANRDEFHTRPAESLHWWADDAGVLAGRDLQAGGTWLGVRRDGRFACVLNGPGEPPGARAPSRGALVPQVLAAADGRTACDRVMAAGGRYGAFHLLAGDAEQACYVSNTGAAAAALGRGRHTVDNAGLNRDDGRSRRLYHGFAELPDVSRASLLGLLADEQVPERCGDDRRPVFLRDARFGTRCSTLLWIGDSGRIDVIERRFDEGGAGTGEIHHAWHAHAVSVGGP